METPVWIVADIHHYQDLCAWNSARLREQKGGLAEDAMLLFAAEISAALPRARGELSYFWANTCK